MKLTIDDYRWNDLSILNFLFDLKLTIDLDETAAERWSYMQEGKQVFSDAGVIGLTCDAVHIGDSDCLNCILWNADRAVGYVCPPQAGPLENSCGF